MHYLCLIYSAPDTGPADDAGAEEYMRGYWEFNDEVQQAGVFVAGEPLQPVETATTVRVRDGEAIVTDGPFAETKEHLGGFYLLDCENLDEALRFAAKIPTATHGSIEVRPLLTLPPRPEGI